MFKILCNKITRISNVFYSYDCPKPKTTLPITADSFFEESICLKEKNSLELVFPMTTLKKPTFTEWNKNWILTANVLQASNFYGIHALLIWLKKYKNKTK